jgi:hypothetical protein
MNKSSNHQTPWKQPCRQFLFRVSRNIFPSPSPDGIEVEQTNKQAKVACVRRGERRNRNKTCRYRLVSLRKNLCNQPTKPAATTLLAILTSTQVYLKSPTSTLPDVQQHLFPNNPFAFDAFFPHSLSSFPSLHILIQFPQPFLLRRLLLLTAPPLPLPLAPLLSHLVPALVLVLFRLNSASDNSRSALGLVDDADRAVLGLLFRLLRRIGEGLQRHGRSHALRATAGHHGAVATAVAVHGRDGAVAGRHADVAAFAWGDGRRVACAGAGLEVLD